MSRLRSFVFVVLIISGLVYLSIAQAQLPTQRSTQYLAIVFGQPPSPTPTATPLPTQTPSPTPLPPALEAYALDIPDLPDGYTVSEEKYATDKWGTPVFDRDFDGPDIFSGPGSATDIIARYPNAAAARKGQDNYAAAIKSDYKTISVPKFGDRSIALRHSENFRGIEIVAYVIIVQKKSFNTVVFVAGFGRVTSTNDAFDIARRAAVKLGENPVCMDCASTPVPTVVPLPSVGIDQQAAQDAVQRVIENARTLLAQSSAP